jgi:AcrR family transcriptional regulator
LSRPPSKEAHDKVLKTALRLIAERGVESTTMDAIASESGVSKATIYKHWPNKDALVVDAVRTESLHAPEFNSGNVRNDLLALLTYLASNTKTDELARVWPKVMSYSAANPPFARVLQEQLFTPRRDRLLRMIKMAVDAGALKAGIEPELAADLLIGPIMHRRFVSNNHVPKDLPEKVVEAFFKAFAP